MWMLKKYLRNRLIVDAARYGATRRKDHRNRAEVYRSRGSQSAPVGPSSQSHSSSTWKEHIDRFGPHTLAHPHTHTRTHTLWSSRVTGDVIALRRPYCRMTSANRLLQHWRDTWRRLATGTGTGTGQLFTTPPDISFNSLFPHRDHQPR